MQQDPNYGRSREPGDETENLKEPDTEPTTTGSEPVDAGRRPRFLRPRSTPAGELSPQDERTWSILSHVSVLAWPVNGASPGGTPGTLAALQRPLAQDRLSRPTICVVPGSLARARHHRRLSRYYILCSNLGPGSLCSGAPGRGARAGALCTPTLRGLQGQPGH